MWLKPSCDSACCEADSKADRCELCEQRCRYIKSERAFLPHLKRDCVGKIRGTTLTSQTRRICERPLFFSPHFFFLFLSLSRLPPFCHPQPLFLCHFVRSLSSAASFTLSLGCSSVVAYTRFSVMFSLLSAPLLVYQIAQAHIKQVNEASRGWTLLSLQKKKGNRICILLWLC